MSILSNIWSDMLTALFPVKCLVCGGETDSPTSRICTKCFSSISYTRYWRHYDNPMSEHARDLQPFVECASALLFYDSYSRDMIHRLKYRGEWSTAQYLGEILGAYLTRESDYQDVDVVIPVPLHPLRRFSRGYNQAEYIAKGVASKIGVKCKFRTLYRRRYTAAQANRSNMDRWEDREDLFGVRNGEALRAKHILLIDDVYTTGATIFSCVEIIHKMIPDCRVSIATLAISRRYGV